MVSGVKMGHREMNSLCPPLRCASLFLGASTQIPIQVHILQDASDVIFPESTSGRLSKRHNCQFCSRNSCIWLHQKQRVLAF